MSTTLQLENITIRTQLQPGDIGFVTYLHGFLYWKEYNYGIAFENYVAKGLLEFISNLHPAKDRVWICEYSDQIVGFMLLMNRNDATAQLRYFLLAPGFRGIGLGRKLMEEFMYHLKSKAYKHAYLWTTHEQEAAAYMYKKAGFKLTEEKDSTAFGKPLKEQRYDLYL